MCEHCDGWTPHKRLVAGECNRLRADLARVTGERTREALDRQTAQDAWNDMRRQRDTAIARAEEAESHVTDLTAELDRACRERDHWRAVAESRPAITAEDAGKVDLAPTDDLAAVIRVSDTLRAHAAKAKPSVVTTVYPVPLDLRCACDQIDPRNRPCLICRGNDDDAHAAKAEVKP
jgi:hypothetical protein